MDMPRVKIVETRDADSCRIKCCVNGKEVDAQNIEFRVAVDEFPQFVFETIGLPDIDMIGDVRFRFTPQTVQQAAVVLQNELIANRDLRGTFLESMLSALDDNFWNSREAAGDQLDIGYDDFKEAAELMLNRLIGIEKQKEN